jgi:hypothetical protein
MYPGGYSGCIRADVVSSAGLFHGGVPVVVLVLQSVSSNDEGRGAAPPGRDFLEALKEAEPSALREVII